VIKKERKVEGFCWKGGDWEAVRGRSGKLRRMVGKMKTKVILNPSSSSAMYVPVFGKLCFSDNFLILSVLSKKSI